MWAEISIKPLANGMLLKQVQTQYGDHCLDPITGKNPKPADNMKPFFWLKTPTACPYLKIIKAPSCPSKRATRQGQNAHRVNKNNGRPNGGWLSQKPVSAQVLADLPQQAPIQSVNFKKIIRVDISLMTRFLNRHWLICHAAFNTNYVGLPEQRTASPNTVPLTVNGGVHGKKVQPPSTRQ